jgi:riboflavin synthase
VFTGIVQGTRRVDAVTAEHGRRRLWLDLEDLAGGLVTGASVAVAGTCLTVVAIDGTRVAFDVIAETLANTSLGTLVAGSRVNVERSLRAGDELGGHVVSGHVGGIARIRQVVDAGGERRLRLEVPQPLLRCIFHKGFVALDGASLTVAAVDRGAACIEVALIPETLRRTTFGAAAVGQPVNVEVDAATRAIVDTVTGLVDELLADRVADAVAAALGGAAGGRPSSGGPG